jgi:hypothetical protein
MVSNLLWPDTHGSCLHVVSICVCSYSYSTQTERNRSIFCALVFLPYVHILSLNTCVRGHTSADVKYVRMYPHMCSVMSKHRTYTHIQNYVGHICACIYIQAFMRPLHTYTHACIHTYKSFAHIPTQRIYTRVLHTYLRTALHAHILEYI